MEALYDIMGPTLLMIELDEMGEKMREIEIRKKRFLTIDLAMVCLLIAKLFFFYWITDMTGIRMIGLLITALFIVQIGLSFSLSRRKGTLVVFGILYGLISLLMFVDSMYFSYFNQLPSMMQLMQLDAMMVVDADTLKVSLPPLNILLLADIPFAIWYYKKLSQRFGRLSDPYWLPRLKMANLILVLTVLVAVVNPLHADAFKIVNQSEFVTYHLRDIYEQVSGQDLIYVDTVREAMEVVEGVNENINGDKASPETDEEDGVSGGLGRYGKLAGIGEGNHLIVIQVESLQDFVIGKTVNGVELTPNLNRLIGENSLYFDNYYQTIGRGNTSDAEFASNNSVYPVMSGGVYDQFFDHEFKGLPWILKRLGYRSVVYHGYMGEFWNREAAYPNQGFDDFLSMEDLDVNEKIAFGISDKSLYSQALEDMDERYHEGEKIHSFMVSLSCHYPYEMPEEYGVIEDQEDARYGSLFANYLAGVRYSDDALGMFLDTLKEKPYYDSCVIAIYGDHHGLNCKDRQNKKFMSGLLGKDYDFDEMLNVPLIIHSPALVGISEEEAINHKVGGQVDLLPTLGYLMGFDPGNEIFGQNLLDDGSGFVASVTYMLKGSFVKNDIIFQASSTEVFDEGRAWNRVTGEVYEDIDFLYEDYIRACQLVEASEYMLENDLLDVKRLGHPLVE